MRRRKVVDAGVVDQDIDLAEGRGRGRGEAAYIGERGDVSLDKGGVAEFTRDGLAARLVTSRNDDACACVHERSSDSAPDARGAAGNQGPLAL